MVIPRWGAFAVGGLGLLILLIATAVLLGRGDNRDATPTPLAVARVAATPARPPATPAPPAASPVAPEVACAERCLVRFADIPMARGALERFGVRPVYAHDGSAWAAVPVAALPSLAAVAPVVVTGEAGETLRLHVMRIPQGGDPAPVEAAGDIVDRVGNQFIVRVAEVPFVAAPLTEAGIWVEKLPPYPPQTPTARPAPLTEIGDLGELAGAVSVDNIAATIADLERMDTGVPGTGTRYYTSPGNVQAAEYIFDRLRGYGLDVWYEDFVTNDGYLALNVVGELPGRDPGAVYLVLGHFDSTNDAGGAAAPGADDNASGIAAMLEIARILSGYQLLHPVRFLASNVEEVGIQGAPAFARRAAEAGIPIDGAFNVDAVGSAANGRLLILNGDESSIWLQDILIEMNDRFGLGQELRVRQNPAIVADDNFLRDYGIPTVLLAREMYGWSATHHTPDDVLATVDLENVRAATQLVAVSVGSLVQE